MYTFDSRVRFSEVDQDGYLRPDSIINYFQDCATFHAESMGLGVSHQREHHMAWLLSAWQIHIDRLPRFTERITTATWCHSMDRLQSIRDFTITDDAGQVCVRANSLWFVFDTNRRLPMRVPESELAFVSDEKPIDLPRIRRKIAVSGDFREVSRTVAGPEHIDANHHVNNARYVLMALDAATAASGSYPQVEDRIHNLESIRVQYKQMALLGDTIVACVQEDDGQVIIDLRDPEGGSYAVVALSGRDEGNRKEDIR